MRISIVALILTWGFASTAQAQQFASPIDLVETLYSSHFSGLVIDDFAPYLYDRLTAQMDGKVGVSEFEVLGLIPSSAMPTGSRATSRPSCWNKVSTRRRPRLASSVTMCRFRSP